MCVLNNIRFIHGSAITMSAHVCMHVYRVCERACTRVIVDVLANDS